MPRKTTNSEKHPSYGLLGFSRVSSSQSCNLFGSPHRHQQYITCTLHQATIERGDYSGSAFYHANKELFSVAMSRAQFGELVSSFNMGGIPVTIERLNQDFVEECPESNPRKEIMDDFKEKVEKVTDKCEKMEHLIHEKLLGGKLLMEDRKQLAGAIRHLVCEVRNNIPFVEAQYNEAIDKTVQSAKAEVHEYFERAVAKFGLDSLHDKLKSALDEPLKLADGNID